MTIARKPIVWMIAMEDNPISVQYRDRVMPSWMNMGFQVNLFNAITPKDLPNLDELKFEKKHRKNGDKLEFTDTEKSVWYSHYLLWKKCFDTKTPLIVCEHDVELLENIDIQEFDNDMVSLSHSKRDIENHPIVKHAGGSYFIKPNIAEKLINISNKVIICNSDWWLHQHVDEFGKWSISKSIHIVDPDIGVTVKHNK